MKNDYSDLHTLTKLNSNSIFYENEILVINLLCMIKTVYCLLNSNGPFAKLMRLALRSLNEANKHIHDLYHTSY